MRTIALAVLAALAAAGARAGDAAPQRPLALSGDGPYYTLAVTLAARQLSERTDLADLRVRNAAGEPLPFAWAGDAGTPGPEPQRVPARLYKVPSPEAQAASAATTTDGRPRQSWIVDSREARLDLVALDLALEPGAQGAWTLRIDASDDLQHWRMVQDDAQLVQLQPLPQVGGAPAFASPAGARQLRSDPLELDGRPARYLRLTAARRSGIPPLVAATIVRMPHRPAAPRLEWSAPIAATRCEADACDYTLPQGVPIDAVQIAPSEVDTIGQVMLSVRADAAPASAAHRSLLRGSLHALREKAGRHARQPGPAWVPLLATNVYWLTQPAGTPALRSPPVRLEGGSWPALRLETSGPIAQLGHEAPSIRIGVRPRQLVFVARGAGPYVLARAAIADPGAPMPLPALMPGRQPDDPLPGATAFVNAPDPGASAAVPAAVASAASAVATSASGTAWLWSALLAGLALMGAMAWSLLRKPARSASGDNASKVSAET